MHESVDLKLSVLKREGGGFLYLLVDDLSHPGVETHLAWEGTRKSGV